MRRLVVSLVAGVTLLVVGAAGGAALAAGKLHILSKACVATVSRAVTAPTKGKCPKGTLLEQVGSSTPGKTGATGATGPQGPQGPQGLQGPAGTPATAKSFVVTWQQGGTAPLNASSGVTLTSGPFENAAAHTEETLWHFPVDLTTCAQEVSVAGQIGAVYSGTTAAQVARKAGDPTSLWVLTQWGGGSGTDFSLLITCP